MKFQFLVSLFVLQLLVTDASQSVELIRFQPSTLAKAEEVNANFNALNNALFAKVVVPDDVDDVARAVASLPTSGGTVFVKARPACYPITSSVHIDRSNISLVGEQGATLCLENGIKQPVVLIGPESAHVPLDARIKNIRVEGLIIDGNRDNQGDQPEDEDAIGRPHLKNNAISIHGAVNVFLERLVLKNARSGGLVISQQSASIFISDAIFAGNFFDGIAIDGGHQVFLSHFKSEFNDGSGVSIDTGSSLLQLSDGLIRNNGDNGLFVRMTSMSRFKHLSIENNCNHGVFASHVFDGQVVPNSGVRELFFTDLSIVRNGGAGVYYGSNSNEPFGSVHNIVHGSLLGGNANGHIEGDVIGRTEIDAGSNHIIASLSGIGPKDNPFCP